MADRPAALETPGHHAGLHPTISISAATVAGLSFGLLIAVPLLGVLTGAGAGLYLVPLGGFVFAASLGGSRRSKVAVPRAAGVYGSVLTLFVCWMGLSATWTIANVSVMDELSLLAALLAMSVAAIVALDERAVEATILSALAVAVGVAAWVFRNYAVVSGLGGYGELADTYLVVAQAVGLGAVLALVRAMTRTGRQRLFAILAAAVLVPALALSLARGALLATVLVTIAAAVYWNAHRSTDRRSFRQWLHDRAGRLALLAGVVGVAGVALGGALQVERTRARLERLFSGREFTESARPGLWREAWSGVENAPLFGHGLGSSGLMSGTTEQFYPHNWLLQVWLDGGLVGLVLCVAALAIPVVHVLASGRRAGPEAIVRTLPFAAAYLFLLLEYSKSSNFYTARLLFVIGAVMIYAARVPRRT